MNLREAERWTRTNPERVWKESWERRWCMAAWFVGLFMMAAGTFVDLVSPIDYHGFRHTLSAILYIMGAFWGGLCLGVYFREKTRLAYLFLADPDPTEDEWELEHPAHELLDED